MKNNNVKLQVVLNNNKIPSDNRNHMYMLGTGHFCTSVTFARGETFARRLFCTSVTLARGDTFARRVTFARGKILHGDTFARRFIFARRHFYTSKFLHDVTFAWRNFAKRHFCTALYFHEYTYELRES